ncbi:MAG: bifunctional diguanylate cyclase/phosphodiesterase [Deltaproteobacteria bacterium]|nr:bifunctional diguanylate cyclase/phosphodiesterase [Nannocystaceae bacterium]
MANADAYESLIQFLYRAPIGLVQATASGAIEMLNPMSARLLMPLSRDGSLDNLFDTLREVAPQIPGLVAGFRSADGVICDSFRIPLDATPRPGAPEVLSLSLLKLDESRLMAVLQDVSLEVRREQQGLAHGISVVARIDGLTQLPNRAAVREQLLSLRDRPVDDTGQAYAVLFMNCDRFSRINDMLGPAAGDQVLSAIADRLRSFGGFLAARIGGDEFVVVLAGVRGGDDADALARSLLDVLAAPHSVGARQLHCTVSMGVVVGEQALRDPDAVLQDASIAMAEAKRSGGGRCVVFEPAMHERATRRAGMEAELRRALVQDELFVVYQPVIGLNGSGDSGDCVGVEALVRWRHPVCGVVPPLEFISVAEECGLIGALGNFVLETACRQFVQWQRQLGPRAPGVLAVNVSRGQLHEPRWVAEVSNILRASGMAPKFLQLEITESLAAQDSVIQTRLHQLKALGLTIALDDFGTGYSSLSSLHLLPVDTVKVDRSFVSQADTSQHHRVLIEATVRVANSLGMGTVAEGIETVAQADAVRELGCEKGQGYLFSRPLAADDVAQWLTARCDAAFDRDRPDSAA